MGYKCVSDQELLVDPHVMRFQIAYCAVYVNQIGASERFIHPVTGEDTATNTYIFNFLDHFHQHIRIINTLFQLKMLSPFFADLSRYKHKMLIPGIRCYQKAEVTVRALHLL